ncbi:MAG TPA: TIR domain-containing protein [Verrucomicrobiota bacterium]|nr:TIR domain-containing protein [Verrucomicrobiota bacterium]
MPALINQVFLSYRHESPEHARAVKRLGELLRQANLPVVLDQFSLDEHPGGPDAGGWPKWCEDCANQSPCVVIVASEGWFAAYESPGSVSGGFGAASEARLFRQDLYEQKGNNERLRLAFLHEVVPDKVPKGLRAWHQFRPFDRDDQLDQLVRWIASRLEINEKDVVDFEPDCADRRDTEWPVIRDLLTGRSRERVLLLEGRETGLGKTELLRQAARYADVLRVPVARINFKGGGLDVAGVLGQFHLELKEHLPNFCREGASRTHLLRRDLRDLRRPVFVLFDHFEDVAENRTVADWLTQHFLPEVETALGLAVIVAGQRVPDHAAAIWGGLARHVLLQPIDELEHWELWVGRKFPGLKDKGAHLPTILMLARGNPSVVANSCRAIAGG